MKYAPLGLPSWTRLQKPLAALAIFSLACLASACGESVVELDGESEGDVLASELRVCAQSSTVKGIDVSFYQGVVDWQRVKGDGYKFGIARISDGTRHIDDQFERNWREIKAKGLVRGSYQFFRPQQSAEAQANLVVQKVGRLGDGDLPVVLDVETADGASSARIRQQMRTWIDIVERGTGKKPVIYAASGFWDSLSGMDEFGSHDLWVANYTTRCPAMPRSWDDWVMWQYTDRGSVSGIRGGVDVNHFNGTYEDLLRYANSGGDSRPPTTGDTDGKHGPIEVYWARLSDGSYKLHALAGAATVRVEYYVDGYKIGESTRAQGDNFPANYAFDLEKRERFFEIKGFDSNNTQITRGVGLLDVTDEVAVYIRQLAHTTYEIGLERAPSGVAGLEVVVDGKYLLTDSLSQQKRSTRLAVRSPFSTIGERSFTLTTYNADGSVRGHLRRTFTLPAVKGMDPGTTVQGQGEASSSTPGRDASANAIDATYYYQYNNRNEPSATCGVTSAAMLLSQFGKTLTPDDLYRKYGKAKGQSPVGLADIYRWELGYGKGTYKGSIAQIKRHVDAGRPVVIHGWFTGPGHIMTVIGYNETGLVVHDPSGKWAGCRGCGYPGRTSTNGRQITYSYTSLLGGVIGADGDIWMSVGSTSDFQL